MRRTRRANAAKVQAVEQHAAICHSIECANENVYGAFQFNIETDRELVMMPIDFSDVISMTAAPYQ
jgi:hypothetical protein